MRKSLEGLGHTVVCERVDHFTNPACDAYIVGSAVYAFSARRAGMGNFLRRYAKVLAQKPLSIFIVCGADPLPPKEQSPDSGLKKFFKYRFINPDNYLRQLKRAFPAQVTHTAIFKGYDEAADKEKIGFDDQEQRAAAFARESVTVKP